MKYFLISKSYPSDPMTSAKMTKDELIFALTDANISSSFSRNLKYIVDSLPYLLILIQYTIIIAAFMC